MHRRLVEEYPDRALSWFAVGCYYLCTHQHDKARRHFGKATSMENNFAAAWIGFGNAFAFQDESDQVSGPYTDVHVASMPCQTVVLSYICCYRHLLTMANVYVFPFLICAILRPPCPHVRPCMIAPIFPDLHTVTRSTVNVGTAGLCKDNSYIFIGVILRVRFEAVLSSLSVKQHLVSGLQAMAAYRTAARLFPGLHLPLTGMGMEYQRMNNLHLAEQMFLQVCCI